jgi:hypothetical protein
MSNIYSYEPMNPSGLCIGDIVGLQVSFKLIPARQNASASYKLISVLRGVSLIENRHTMVRDVWILRSCILISLKDMIKRNSDLRGRSRPRPIKRKLAFVKGPSKRQAQGDHEKDITNRLDKMAVDDSQK